MNLTKIVIIFSILFFQLTIWCEKLTVREIGNAELQQKSFYCLDWHKNNALAMGERNGTITIITETQNTTNTKTKKSPDKKPWDLCGIKNMPAHKKAITMIKWNNTGKRIASASLDNVIKIWKLKKEDACEAVLTHKNTLVGIDWNPLPKFKHIIATASKHMIKIWNIKISKKPILKKHFDEEICSICWHPEGKHIVIGLYNNKFNAMPPEVPIFKGKLIKGRLVLFNVYIELVIRAYRMENICENKKDYVMLPSHLLFKNNETFLCSELGGNLKQHTVKDLAGSKPFKKNRRQASVYNIAYNTTTDITAAFCQEYDIMYNQPCYINSIKFWKNNIFMHEIFLETNIVSAMAFNPQGNFLVYISGEGKMHILEIKTDC